MREKRAESVADLSPETLLTFVRRDSAAPIRWCDYGDALLKSGRTEEARRAFERALELGPRSPHILYRTASFHRLTGDLPTAYRLTRSAITNDPERLLPYIAPYEGAVSVDDLLENALPDDGDILRAVLRHRLSQENAADTAAIWARMLQRGYVDAEAAASYSESMVRAGLYKEGWDAWRQYVTRAEAGPAENAVSNGGFELDPSRTRFDWRMSRSGGVTTGFDRDVKYSGGRSIRIDFRNADNPLELGVGQVVYLERGRYRFSAYVRTDRITTDGGVAFRLVSERSAKNVNVTTRHLVGTNDWTLIEQELDVPEGTELVRLSLVRPRSFSFDRLVSGTAWVDQVSLTRVPPA
jgi:hypothetical protein